MSREPEVLVFGVDDTTISTAIDRLEPDCHITRTSNFQEILTALNRTPPSACVLGQSASNSSILLEVGGLLQHFPDAVLVLNADEEILWANDQAKQQLQLPDPHANGNAKQAIRLFDAWNDAIIVGPDFCPISTVLATNKAAHTTVGVQQKSFYRLTVSPIATGGANLFLLATIRETTDEILQQQKLDAIYRAGLELGDLQPDELEDLSTEDRIDLLRSKLKHYTKTLLEFETVEIRVVDQRTKRLKPLLAMGMNSDAEQRELYVSYEGNGVTGYVAASGRSYLCEDTSTDKLYLEGAAGARSSLTVPLILHDQVLGTFNVESPRRGAFNATDLKLLELFCRELALALNTLDLLVAEKAQSVFRSSNKVFCEVADPVNEILNDIVWLNHHYDGQVPQIRERIFHVLENSQEIRKLMLEANESDMPEGARGFLPEPILRSKRILLVDQDRESRRKANEILVRCGCIVDSAYDGNDALLMIRQFHYHAVITDLRLKDMNGAELIRQIREFKSTLPVIIAKGFEYDSDHIMLRARENGMSGQLYKPFIPKQLVNTLSSVIT